MPHMDPLQEISQTKNKWKSQRIRCLFERQGLEHVDRWDKKKACHTNSTKVNKWADRLRSARIEDFNAMKSICRKAVHSEFDDQRDFSLYEESVGLDHDIPHNKPRELILADYLSLQNKDALVMEAGDDQNEGLQIAIQLSLCRSERTPSGARKRVRKRHRRKRKRV